MIEVDIEVEDVAWTIAMSDVEAVIERAVKAGLEPQTRGQVSVLLCNDAEIQMLNARFRQKDRPTNVLSFPAAASARPLIGDLALAFETCRNEAEQQCKSLESHLQHLVVHGALHLIGYDHENDTDAEIMENKEREILATLGVADPYESRDGPINPDRILS